MEPTAPLLRFRFLSVSRADLAPCGSCTPCDDEAPHTICHVVAGDLLAKAVAGEIVDLALREVEILHHAADRRPSRYAKCVELRDEPVEHPAMSWSCLERCRIHFIDVLEGLEPGPAFPLERLRDSFELARIVLHRLYRKRLARLGQGRYLLLSSHC